MKPLWWCCALAFVVALTSVGRSQSLPKPWGTTNEGLRMTMSSGLSEEKGLWKQQFYIMVENVGDRDVVLNLGRMLANGKVMWPTAVSLSLTDGGGRTQELQYKATFVAGRMDDYVVALRVGSAYSLLVMLDRYYPTPSSGHYRIVARFDGQGATTHNPDMQGLAAMNFWKGALASNVVEVDVR
jgi:hypothetical protein